MGKTEKAELPDFFDLLAFLGIVSIAYGLWILSPPAAFLIVGVLLFVLGAIPPISEGTPDGDTE